MKLRYLVGIAVAFILIAPIGPISGATWTAVKALNPNASSDLDRDDDRPAIATDGAGRWISVWASNEAIGLDFEAYSAYSSNNANTWQGPITVNSDYNFPGEGQDITQDITTDGNGTWIATWVKNVGPGTGSDSDVFYSRSFNNGVSWSTLLPLNSDATTDSLSDQFPSTVSDGTSTVVTIWGAINNTTKRCYMKSSRSLDKGATWQPAQFVFPTPLRDSLGPNTEYALATDKKGVWMAIAHSTMATSTTTGSDADIIAFRSTDAGQTWSAPIVVNKGAETDSINQEYPHIATDERGVWIATWVSQSSIMVAKSTDSGLTWSEPESLTTSGVPKDTAPWVESDKHGSWLLAWENRTKSTDYEIEYAQSSDNAKTWFPMGFLNSNSATDNSNDLQVKLKSNENGRWVAVWNSKNILSTGGGPDSEINFATTDFSNPETSLSVSLLDFGTVDIDDGPTATLNVVIANSGLAPLAFAANGIRIEGLNMGSFAIVNTPTLSALSPGQAKLVTIQFDPASAGPQSAVLTVLTNGSSSPDYVNLLGMGTTQPSVINDWMNY